MQIDILACHRSNVQASGTTQCTHVFEWSNLKGQTRIDCLDHWSPTAQMPMSCLVFRPQAFRDTASQFTEKQGSERCHGIMGEVLTIVRLHYSHTITCRSGGVASANCNLK